jgi:hypothetical protein
MSVVAVEPAPVMLPAAGRSHSGWLDMCTVLVRRVNG